MPKKKIFSFLCDSFEDSRQPEDKGNFGHFWHIRTRLQRRSHIKGTFSFHIVDISQFPREINVHRYLSTCSASYLASPTSRLLPWGRTRRGGRASRSRDKTRRAGLLSGLSCRKRQNDRVEGGFRDWRFAAERWIRVIITRAPRLRCLISRIRI